MKLSILVLGSVGALVFACSSGSPGTGGFGTGNGTGSGSGSGSSSGGSGGSNSSSGTTSSSGSAGSSSSGGGSSSGSGGPSSGGSSSGGSSTSSSGGSSGSSGGSSSGSSSGGSSSYPPGPYAANCSIDSSGMNTCIGQIMPDLTWMGYVAPTASSLGSYVSYSLNDARLSGAKYAMINLGDFNCPSCQQSAMELSSGAAAVIAKGGVVIEVLTSQDIGAAPATQTDLENWIQAYQLTNTTVIDPPSMPLYTLNDFGPREQAYIVDLSTMKIVEVAEGVIDGTPHSAGVGLSDMQTLL